MSHARRCGALAYGIVCHSLFAGAVILLFTTIYHGFANGHGALHGAVAIVANVFLPAQFAFIHSCLLRPRGRKLLDAISVPFGRSMATTTFVIVSALQLIFVCYWWSPSGISWAPLPDQAAPLFTGAYVASWLYLAKSMFDAGFAVQSGALGWTSVFRGKKVEYPPMPITGTFRCSRHPIYLAFFLILWMSPAWTVDKLIVGVIWGAYLICGPRMKEQRLLIAFGDAYRSYARRTPYFVPSLRLLAQSGVRVAANVATYLLCLLF